MSRIAALAIAVALALLLLSLAIGRSAPPASAGATTSTRAPAQASAGARVNIPGFKFRPQTLSVAKGTRVLFVNSSGAPHTATRRGSFDTSRIKAGQSVAVRFGSKGTFRYFCKLHPFMRGTIVVG